MHKHNYEEKRWKNAKIESGSFITLRRISLKLFSDRKKFRACFFSVEYLPIEFSALSPIFAAIFSTLVSDGCQRT